MIGFSQLPNHRNFPGTGGDASGLLFIDILFSTD
jgi:hypothetical protein